MKQQHNMNTHNIKIYDVKNSVKGKTIVGTYLQYDDTLLEVYKILHWGMHIYLGTLPRSHYSKQRTRRATTLGKAHCLTNKFRSHPKNHELRNSILNA